jgi:hypothetical protein
MDAWIAGQQPGALSLNQPTAEQAADARQPMALQPPPPDTATDVFRATESGLAKIPGLGLGIGGDAAQFIPAPRNWWSDNQPDETALGKAAAFINPGRWLPKSSTINDDVAAQMTRMRNAAPGSSLSRLSAQYGPTTDDGKLYEAQTTPGGYAETIATMAAAGRPAGTLLQRGARVVVPGVTSETARQLPGVKGTALEPVAATVGAVLGGAGVGAAEGVAARRAQSAAVPTTHDIFTEAGNEYRQHGGTPVALNQQFMDALQGGPGRQAIQTALRGAEANRDAPLMAELNGLLGNAPPTQITANAAEAIRRAFGTMGRAVMRGTEPDENVVRGYYGRQADVEGVLAQVPEIQGARRLWSRAERSQLIDDAMTAATQAYGTPASFGDRAQAIRREFLRLTRSRDFDGFTAPEQEAIMAVANGNFTANLLQRLGKFSPVRNYFSGLLGAGGVFGGYPLTAASIAAGGELARQGSNLASAAAVRRASQLVRSGGATQQRPSIAGPALRQAITAGIFTDRNRPLDDSYAARIDALARP